ncbi:zinc finger CCHC domain-containing protein 7 isoform X1 [Leguminivora glycinivorella]|uniref:zinc finger CCHC domain-containing protein 7 isoform X1 n=1 Tax=Leguminivora glycinivorella TaxID=1035111 RepID=UPI00200C8EC7|nr:zinc finger CCHC domain-containing protein 7 isoform X1 [Leguminivora glycinivorella]
MDKFYNESWGGENFNHQEIQKNMSRDKSLWVIDPKDRMPNPPKRRVTCNYCNRGGHRDDTCRLKPPVCHMCGHTGHYEPRCPRKICVNCGSPNFMYSTSCRNCTAWRALTCAECGQHGHPASHCPDTWRRYHNTIDENMPLEQCGEKPQYQLQCSGCTRRGHLAHTCRTFLPLSSLPIFSPRVARYLSIYPSAPAHTHTPTHAPNTHKRLSNSPTTHETHANKRRNISDGDLHRSRTVSENEQTRSRKIPESEARMKTSSESGYRARKNSQNAPVSEPKEVKNAEAEKAPDFIPIGSNTDGNGQVIQDNEVSDTSEVRTSARFYINFGVKSKLSSRDGQDWLNQSIEKFNVDIQYNNANSFLTVVGTVGDQEAFHSALKAWSGRPEPAPPKAKKQKKLRPNISLMPIKKKDILRKLKKLLRCSKMILVTLKLF